jgi:CHAD domain-containing protein
MRSRINLLPAIHSKFERALELVTSAPAQRFPPTRVTGGARARVPDASVTVEAPVGMSEDDLLLRLASMGFQARPPGKRTDRVLFRDTHDGGLLRTGRCLCFFHSSGTWRLLKGDSLEAEEPGTVSAPARDGAIAESLSLIVRTWPAVHHLDASLDEAEYRLAGLAERQIRLRVQRWQLESPFQEVPPRSSMSLRASGDPSATGIGYFGSLLRDRLGCRPMEGTLLAWGLTRLGVAVPGASPPVELSLSPQDGMRAACAKILRTEAWRIRASFHGARRDIDPEYVHDFRVATRRSRFALKLFAGALPAGRADQLRAELAWIAGLLGAVRDIDVLVARLERQFLLMDAGPDFQSAIRSRLGETRDRAQAQMSAALQSERCSFLLNALENTPGAEGEGADVLGTGDAVPPALFARRRIDKAFGQLQRWLNRSAEELQDTELHGLRILFKRLRYTCDFFRPILAQGVGELVKSFVAYQDCLGLHHDAVVALEFLKGLPHDVPSDSEQYVMSLGALMQVQRTVLREHRARFLDLWETADTLVATWKQSDERGGKT